MAKIFEFNATKGSLIDQVSKTKGTLTAGTDGFVKTSKGMSLFCDNATTKLDFGTSTVNTGNLTFEAIIKVKGNGENGNGRIFSNGKIELIGKNTFTISSDGSTLVSSASISYNYWYHLIVTRTNAGIVNFYVNGILSGSANQNSGTPATGTTNMIVGSTSGTANTFNGLINKVVIYNSILTSSEINNLYKKFINSTQTFKQKTNFTYPKPTSLNENGLVVAYNFIPQNGVLSDLSGNGYSGTISGPISNNLGLKFDGTNDFVSFGTDAGIDSSDFSICGAFIYQGDNSTENVISNFKGATNTGFKTEVTTAGRLTFTVGDGTTYSVYKDDVLVPGQMTNYCAIVDRTDNELKLYINGVLEDTEDITGLGNIDSTFNIAAGQQSASTNSNFFSGTIIDVRVYNRVISEEEAIKYHNQFIKPTLIEDFSDEGADEITKTPREWIVNSGSFKISELSTQDSVIKDLDKGTKYLECTSDGMLSIQSKQAYGTWEFDFFPSSSSARYIQFISNNLLDTNSANQGYDVLFLSNRIYFQKYSAGRTSLFYTSTVDNVVPYNKWYGIKITRTLNGEFTAYIKGGSFGDNYVLINTTNGGGANPATDATYTTSEFFTLDLTAGDRIANIKISNGVK